MYWETKTEEEKVAYNSGHKERKAEIFYEGKRPLH